MVNTMRNSSADPQRICERVRGVGALPDYQGLTQEFYDYITPLIQGEPALIMENGIPKTVKPFNMR